MRAALTELRRLRWRDVSPDEALERHGETGSRSGAFAEEEPTPEEVSTRKSMLASVRNFIDEDLTERQRAAMKVVIFEGMPLEETARRMGTNRGALYKLMYDARKRLKKRMAAEGLSPQDVLEALRRGKNRRSQKVQLVSAEEEPPLNADRDDLEKVVRAVSRTSEEELGCEECFEQLDRFVEMELSGLNAAEAMPLVKDHLDECEDCREEFEVLLEAL